MRALRAFLLTLQLLPVVVNVNKTLSEFAIPFFKGKLTHVTRGSDYVECTLLGCGSLVQLARPEFRALAFLELANVAFQLDIGRDVRRDLSSGVILEVLELVDQVGLIVGMIRAGEAERCVHGLPSFRNAT